MTLRGEVGCVCGLGEEVSKFSSPVFAQWLESRPVNLRVKGFIPSQEHVPQLQVCSWPLSEYVQEAVNRCDSLMLMFLSPSPFFLEKKKNLWKKCPWVRIIKNS